MNIELRDYQIKAINELKNGSILCGGVGSGKSRVALGYFFIKECQGNIKINGIGETSFLRRPKNLYIITTAKKRDSLEWEKECANFSLSTNIDISIQGIKVTIDSWNNIKKYKDVKDSFFIFDEQRVVGYGAWAKNFIAITRNNSWILLSATPGDKWADYIPVFIANGFYRNKTEFSAIHCVFSRNTTYPKIERYLNEERLCKLRDSILVQMKDFRSTIRNDILVHVDYDLLKYRMVFKNRWDPYEDKPIQETGKLFYLIRKVVNSDESRIKSAIDILKKKKKCIIFYNFKYEIDILKEALINNKIAFSEWNGQKHEELPNGEEWAYLVQYSAGCEGWNCITTDTLIFYSQNYSYRMTEQAKGRIDRINTPYENLYYYYLRSSAPIDLAIYKALRLKKDFNEKSFLKNN